MSLPSRLLQAEGVAEMHPHPLVASHAYVNEANAGEPVRHDSSLFREGATAEKSSDAPSPARAGFVGNGFTAGGNPGDGSEGRGPSGNENAWIPRMSNKNSKHMSLPTATAMQVVPRSGSGGSSHSEGLLKDELGPDGTYVSSGPESIRLGQIQGFGCLVVVEKTSFQIMALSVNAIDMLEMDLQHRPGSSAKGHKWQLAIGMDVRTLISDDSVEVLVQASSAPDLNAVCPIVLSTKASGKPYYAILRRKEQGLMIDFEPVQIDDKSKGPVTGALSSHKIAARAITRLKAVPVGNLSTLCRTVVEEIADLTGYDRVMAYRFHADDHGEVRTLTMTTHA